MTNKSKTIFKASLILLMVSWYSKFLSAISVIVLARNLTKTDFGILASCFVVQGFFNILSNLGGGQYLIRKDSVNIEDLHVSWTINLTSKFLISILMFSLSEYSADFMGIDEIADILKVMSLSIFILGMTNPAINIKIKNLDYSGLSKLEVISRSISSTVSVLIVVIYNSYWAVVIGTLVFSIFYSAGSHFILKTNLRIRFNGINEQWSFSKWILLKGIVSYIKSSADRVVIGRGYSVGELGLYNFANESSSTALSFLISPIIKTIYPSLSYYKDDNVIFSDKMYKFILILSFVYIPIVFGGIYLSDIIVPLIFGSQWIEAIPLFNLFLIMSFSRMLNGIFTDVFTLTGQVKKLFLYEVVTSSMFVFFIYIASDYNLSQFTLLRVVFSYFSLFILVFMLSHIMGFYILRLVLLILPTVLSSTFMVILIEFMIEIFKYDSYYVLLISSIVIGALFYSVFSFFVIFLLQKNVSEYEFIYKTFIKPIYMHIFKNKKVKGY